MLGRSGATEAVTLLAAALADPYWQVRSEVATALGMLSAASELPALVDWLEDENTQVREAVAIAIAAIEERQPRT